MTNSLNSAKMPVMAGRPAVWVPCGYCGIDFMRSVLLAHTKACEKNPANAKKTRKHMKEKVA